MIFIVLFTISILILIVRITTGNKLATLLITIYLLWHGFWLSLSTFNLNGLYTVSSKAYIYLLLGVVMLTIGFVIHPSIKKQKKTNLQPLLINSNFENSITFKYIFIISLLYAISILIKYNNVILRGFDVRSMWFEQGDIFFGHRYLQMVWRWLGGLLNYIIIMIFVIRIYRNRIISFRTLLYALFIITYGYIGSGRAPFIVVLQTIVIIYLINYKTKILQPLTKIIYTKSFRKINFKNRLSMALAIGLLCIIFFTLFGYITALRKGFYRFSLNNVLYGLEIFYNQILIYNIGPFRLFDYALQNNYITKIGILYGRGALASIDYFIFSFFAMLGNNSYPASNNLINNVLQTDIIRVGHINTLNYAYTQNLIFYLDFGVLGIGFLSLLLGYFYRKAVNYFILRSNLFSLLLVVYLTLAIINSNFCYQLQSINALFIITGTLYFARKYQAK